MKNTSRWSAAVLCWLGLSAGLRAQEADAPIPLPKPSDAAVERVVALDQEVAEFTKKWREEQAAERAKQVEEARQAAAEGRPAPKTTRAISMRPDYDVFTTRLLEWSDEASGEDRAHYLVKAVQLGGMAKGSKGMDAFSRLVDGHLSSPQWATIGPMIPMLPRALDTAKAEEVWAQLFDNPSTDVRGWVALAKHGTTMKLADIDSAEYKAARAAILAAAEKVSDERLRSQLEGAVDLREKLADGAVAPDIEGIDIDGVAFKLSDYKGKIIFLDFWGDW